MTFSLFNTNTSPAFEIVWFHQFWWRLFYALIVSSADALIAGILAHISIQCKILQNAITNTINNAHNEVSTIVSITNHKVYCSKPSIDFKKDR